nr:hypothetical protein [Tanacetum cinerariifolium]
MRISVSEEVSATLHNKRTLNKCRILSLVDKAPLRGEDGCLEEDCDLCLDLALGFVPWGPLLTLEEGLGALNAIGLSEEYKANMWVVKGGSSVSTPVDTGMHKEGQQVTGGPTSLGVTCEERANPQLSSSMSTFNLNEPIYSSSFIIHSESASGNDASAASTAEVDPGNSAPSDFIT